MTGHATRAEGRAYARLIRDTLGQSVLDTVVSRIITTNDGDTLGAFDMGFLDVARGVLSTPENQSLSSTTKHS
jgi:hypothetical protein